jgi:hypothetical protein
VPEIYSNVTETNPFIPGIAISGVGIWQSPDHSYLTRGLLMEIRISAKAFAEFVIGGPGKKSSTVRNILRPRAPEAQIPSGYYKRAIGIIRSYHDRDNDFAFVVGEMKSLHKEAELATTPQARAKRNSNLQAVESYMKTFASRKWKVAKCPKTHYSFHDVRISGSPDLAIQDSDRLRLIKIGVRKEKETTDMVRLMLRVIYQAAKTKLKVAAQDITYFDARTGEAISGEPSDMNLAPSIDNGCRILQEMVQAKPA